ncbi:MAG TPA: hypothetical protein VIV66_11565 [Pyrinomonadaceae bacterium]
MYIGSEKSLKLRLLLPSIVILAVCSTFDVAPGYRNSIVASTCAEPKFHNLARYKGQRWSQVFMDPEVAKALKALLKNDMAKLKESLKEVSYPEDSLSYVDKNGVLTLEGGVPGLYTIMEAKLVIEPCGKIYAAILDQGERFLYFTNDSRGADKMNPAIEQWRVKIEALRSQSSNVPELPIVFKTR